jgi:hypothetical protein
LLSLARAQGVLYASQLPVCNGNGNGSDRVRQSLARLLNSRPADLDPVPSREVDFLDADLDAMQREAVNRALHTPDVCLIQGLPGTGKSRVAAEIVSQAARRGERVLLLAQLPAAIDRVLELTGTRDVLCPLRLLGKDERPEGLPAAVRMLTFAERVRALGERAVEESRRQIETTEQRRRRRREDESRLNHCRELAQSRQQLETQAAALEEKRGQLAAVVLREAEAGGELAAALAACARTHQEAAERIAKARAALQVRSAEQHAALDVLAPQLNELRPLAEAKQSGKWWTGTWWKATFAGNTSVRLTELDARRQEIETALNKIEEETHALDQEQAKAEQTARDERQRLVDEECARRQARLTEQADALQRDRALLQEKWQLVLRDLDPDTPRPADMTADAVAAALAGWRGQLDRDEKQAAFAREWADGLASLRDTLPQRLVQHANLVAATTSALPFDEHFGDAASPPVTFDLLVLDQSQLVTESEFLQVARRARRWVMIAELDADEPETSRPAPRSRVPAAPSLFPRLWQHLHCDPRRLPYTWFQEGDRLGCRLRPVPAEQRQYLESEPVVDSPDVELRILARPRSEPVVAEVLFPAGTPLFTAKDYIFKELQELPVRAHAHSLCWSEEPDRLVLRLSPPEGETSLPLPLEEGVRELVAGEGASNGALSAWHTCCLEFDRGAGWQRRRAEEWVRRHVNLHDPARTVRLDVPYRARPELADFLSDLLFGSANGQPQHTNGSTPAFLFVPVPAQGADPGPRTENGRRGGGGGPQRPRPARGGAGLELDLSDLRHRDRLPSELRPELPETGLVNYLEAQAAVRFLETFAAAGASRPSIGVVGLYPAQVELLRRLVRRSAALAALDISIDVPAAFRERECDVVVLSLTRSHSHRAVTFGEGPQALTLALTRARQRLIVFGDPGTLARRSQWEGAVDHLDEAAAARERALITRLLRYLPGDSSHPRVAHLHESSRA